MSDRAKPVYTIGVVAQMLKVHPQTLRFYEKKGLVRPGRTEGQNDNRRQARAPRSIPG